MDIFYQFIHFQFPFQMSCPKGLFSNLMKSKHNDAHKLKRTYLFNQKLGKKNNLAHKLSYGNCTQMVVHQRSRSKAFARSQSIKTNLSLSKKLKTITKDQLSDFMNLPLENLNMDRNLGNSSEQKYEENLKKNEKGENCRICVVSRGKIREHFIAINRMNQIKQFITEQQCMYFVTIPRQHSLQFAIFQSNISGKFLNGQCISFKPQPILPITNQTPTLKHFEFIRPIGCGGFSQVYLTRSKIDGHFYALKVIDKQMIIKNKKQKLVMNERNIMTNCNHPFLVDLKYSFETQKFLIFVMEYCEGGELFGLIRKYNRLEEQTAKFYIIQVLLGLEYLHKQKIVYRDIKPQNILIGADGHIKIADLGLAKPNMQERQLTHSFCGSPEYMSPEMILQQGHTYPVDHYCMGALLYELITGLPPFYSQNASQIYKAVVTQEVTYPSQIQMTTECKNLLRSLLCKDPKHRLGSMYGIKEILVHPWFGKQNYSQFCKKQIQPPITFETFLHFSNAIDADLSEKEKNSFQNFLKEVKGQKTDYKPLLEGFNYCEVKMEDNLKLENLTKKNKSDKNLKIPLLASTARLRLKENRKSKCFNIQLKKITSKKKDRKQNYKTYR